ncbi:MAG: type II secretion system F family protein [Alphaproteobacteria bacterium]|nr:type II secretion system F family protein [Alphaproteobacteria bacterium]
MTLEHALHDPNILAMISGAGAFAVVVLIWVALVESDPLAERLKSVAEHRRNLSDKIEKEAPVSRRQSLLGTDTLKTLVQKLKLEHGRQTSNLRIKLAQAGFHSREAMMIYLLLRLLLPIGLGFLAFFFIFVLQTFNIPFIKQVLYVILAAILGLSLPELYVKNLSQKRSAILRKGLPDALDLLVICAEAGLSLDSALHRVSREIAPSCPEIAEEIGLTAVELGFFPERSQALSNLADRVPLQGVSGLVNTLIQTERYGTPLAQALRILSNEMRNDRVMAAEAKAAKLPATLTVPMILFILPPLFVVLLGPAILRVITMSR